MQKFFSQVVNFFFKLLLVAISLVFAACFLLVGVAMVLFGFAKWALTGKKPAPFATFAQFRQFRQRRKGPFNHFSSGSSASSRPAVPTVSQADVVDVEMREIRVSASVRNDSADVKSQP